jgi:hypothetical protein
MGVNPGAAGIDHGTIFQTVAKAILARIQLVELEFKENAKEFVTRAPPETLATAAYSKPLLF